MATTDAKLNMSLDDLIKLQQRKGGKAGGGATGQKGGKPGVGVGKGKQQPAGKAAPARAPLKVQKGGVQKTTGKPGAKGGPQADVRVVPRPGLRSAAPPRPAPTAAPARGFVNPFAMGMGFMNPMAAALQQQQQQQLAAARMAAMGKWQHDRYEGPAKQPEQKFNTNKLLISNLDFNVSDEDIKELFGNIGELRESGIHYDKSGRSLGTATVVFVRATDAKTAFNKYNGVALDNKRMNIEMVEAPLPPGTITKLSSGINVSKQTGGAAGVRGRGNPQGGDYMQE